MEEKFIKKVFGITLLVYFASICLVYLVSSKQFHYQETQSDTVSQSQVVGEFAEGDTIKQTFTVDSQYLEGVTVTPATYGKTAEGMLEAKITDTNGKNIADIDVDMSELSVHLHIGISLQDSFSHIHVDGHGILGVIFSGTSRCHLKRLIAIGIYFCNVVNHSLTQLLKSFILYMHYRAYSGDSEDSLYVCHNFIVVKF